MPRGRFHPQPASLYFARRTRELTQALRSGFLLSAGGLRSVGTPHGLAIVGTLECEGGIRVEVEERLEQRRGWLRYRDPALVTLVFYRYNAILLNRGPIFRYNSPHEDHRKFHHVHRFDVLGTGAETVSPLDKEEVPTLRQVLKEAEEWYYAHLDRL